VFSYYLFVELFQDRNGCTSSTTTRGSHIVVHPRFPFSFSPLCPDQRNTTLQGVCVKKFSLAMMLTSLHKISIARLQHAAHDVDMRRVFRLAGSMGIILGQRSLVPELGNLPFRITSSSTSTKAIFCLFRKRVRTLCPPPTQLFFE
jgi:hypothetical protein